MATHFWRQDGLTTKETVGLGRQSLVDAQAEQMFVGVSPELVAEQVLPTTKDEPL